MDTTHFSMRVRPNVYPTNIERIEIAITNHTDLEGMGGEEYFIERFDGRAWKGIPQPTAFVALGYPIFQYLAARTAGSAAAPRDPPCETTEQERRTVAVTAI